MTEIRVRITEATIYEKTFDLEELRALCHVKGGTPEIVAEYVRDNEPWPVREKATVRKLSDDSDTWTVDVLELALPEDDQ